MKTSSIMIVGVGGQGTLLASRILGSVMADQGYDVKLSEVHGMAQRGGSVVTYVRYGDKVYSPVISAGTADVIIAFELLEAYRWLPYLKEGGKLIVNVQKINPMPVITGQGEYPDKILDKIKELGVDVVAVDGFALAKQAGNQKAVNVVLIGVLANILQKQEHSIGREGFVAALEKNVPQKFLEINKSAFDNGYNI